MSRSNCLAQDGEFYVFAQSADRVLKGEGDAPAAAEMAVAAPRPARGNADHARATADEAGCGLRAKAPIGWRPDPDITVDPASSQLCLRAQPNQAAPDKRRREGRYLLRTNLTEGDPATLWQYYIQLVAVEEAFKNLKGDLAIRTDLPSRGTSDRGPYLHRLPGPIVQYITLQRRLHALAPGAERRAAPIGEGLPPSR